MAFGRARQRGARTLGITVVIFSLVHMPLPQADFHNIRHHDAPGEVCEHHDHLLRWHPGAGSADDVAILHWHWFLPLPSDPASSGSGSGPALHAHVADMLGSDWDDGPCLLPVEASRLLARSLLNAPATAALSLPDTRVAVVADSRARGPLAFCASFAPRTTFASLLQRWVC